MNLETGNTIICHESNIKGEVVMGEGCIVNPGAIIDGGNKGIVLGNKNVIEELVKIVNNTDNRLIIGDENWFHVGSQVLNPRFIGNNNSFEIGCRVSEGCEIGNYCKISMKTTLPYNMKVESGKCISFVDDAIVMSENSGNSNQFLEDQISFLQNILRGSSMEKKNNS
ncbi:hypothetical protein FG386_001617 [Cryptosporidium ryanae]|uniref:uncharacterized protein n=1 Tax=Cryptosporidium ryanae TaxID=515981 RepID=UPI00351A841C|nr:hypothetical protein FG386_001617 [Cryptosporidium ryanae]